MASNSETFCGVCETQHVVREADFWCPECDEGLCKSCEKHHRASRASRNHEVTSIDNHKQIPPTIASINQYCSDHEKRYQLYCSQHEKLCCPLCIMTDHKTCDLMAIEEIVKTSKTSPMFDIIEQSLQDMKRNLERIVEDRRQNLKKIQKQRQTFQTDIKEIREKTNKHLDKLEQEIQQDIQAAEQKVQSQIERLLSKVSDHGESLDELQKNIFATKSYATDLQSFFGGKMFEADIQKEEMFMQSLTEDGSLQQVNLQCRIADNWSGILAMTKIGEISIKANPQTITLTTVRVKQAQNSIPVMPKTINDIKLTLRGAFEIPPGKKQVMVTGCTIMPTGKIVVVDHVNNCLVILDENGLIHCEIPVSGYPLDVTYVDENTVAVTHTEKPYHIEIINIDRKKIVKIIKTSNTCYGISNEKGRLLYFENNGGIHTAEVTGNSIVTTIVKFDGNCYYNYITTFKDKIYHSSRQTGTVTCYTITGQKVWEYLDKSILIGIYGLTVDNDSNVYVASCTNNSIVVVSPDGKAARRLLGNENGIIRPYGIHFDHGKNILLLTNSVGQVILYDIE